MLCSEQRFVFYGTWYSTTLSTLDSRVQVLVLRTRTSKAECLHYWAFERKSFGYRSCVEDLAQRITSVLVLVQVPVLLARGMDQIHSSLLDLLATAIKNVQANPRHQLLRLSIIKFKWNKKNKIFWKGRNIPKI